MKHYSCVILLVALLAGGCAHSPGRTPSANPSPATPTGLQTPADTNIDEQITAASPEALVDSKPNEEQTTAAPPEKSVEPESTGEGDKDKPDPLQEPQDQTGGKDGSLGDYTPEEEPSITIADPLEPFNRAMFQFNDKLYLCALKPVSQGYGFIMPDVAQVCVQNFFYNLQFPVRFFSCALQRDFKSTVNELGRFTINTLWGIGGLFDPASRKVLNMPKKNVELGDALEFYGLGHWFYIVWPILGPSSARDSIAIVGDYFLYPVSYIQPWFAWLGVRGYELINDTSLSIGNYESLKEAAIDPYYAVRDAYVQHRQKMIIRSGGIKPKQSGPKKVQPEDAGGNQ